MHPAPLPPPHLPLDHVLTQTIFLRVFISESSQDYENNFVTHFSEKYFKLKYFFHSFDIFSSRFWHFSSNLWKELSNYQNIVSF